MLTLDFKTITDEILALTALRKATAANPDEGMLVTRDQLPGLRVLARMVFAEIQPLKPSRISAPMCFRMLLPTCETLFRAWGLKYASTPA